MYLVNYKFCSTTASTLMSMPVTGVKVKRDSYANAVERESRNGVEASTGESIGWNPASFTVLSTTPKPLHTVMEYPNGSDRSVFDTCLN